MVRRISLIAVAISSIASAAAAQCMKDDTPAQVVEGRLTVAQVKDAAGRPERPYILRLPTAACLDAQDPEARVKSTMTIHIYPADSRLARDFRRLVGKTVLVRGRPFAAHTAHHHAPIVMQVTEIDPH
jgi:hypothetical protein